MGIKRNATDVYPTRYHAMDHPGDWAIFAPTNGDQYRSCTTDAPLAPIMQLGATRTSPGELAVLCLPQTNVRWPRLRDGAHVEVWGTRDGDDFVISCHYTAPTQARAQVNATYHASSLDLAIEAAEAWLSSGALATADDDDAG